MVYINASYRISLNEIVIGFIMGSLYLGGGYSYNKLCDTGGMDKLKVFFSLGCHVVFLLLGTYYLKESNAFFIIAIFSNIFYSHPKYSLKKMHNLRVVLNGYFFGLLFLMGCLIPFGRLNKEICLMTAFFILIMYSYEIIHEISHFENDRVDYSLALAKKYIRQVYLLQFLCLIVACLLYYLLKLSVLFIISSLLFNTAFFCIVLYLGKLKELKIVLISRVRVILRYLGFVYGLLLGLSFVSWM